MKYFGKILKNNYVVFAAALFTSFSGFAQDKTPVSQNTNSIKFSTGSQIWNDKNLENTYGNLITFKANYQRELKKDLKLETSFNFFIPKKENTETGEYKLSNFAVNFGLNKHLFVSDDKKIGMYINGGLKYALIKEKVKEEIFNTLAQSEKTETGLGIGYFIGAGLERYLMPRTVLFFEVNLNKTQIEMYKRRLNIGGNELTIGIRLF